jgi:hypothetical protein
MYMHNWFTALGTATLDLEQVSRLWDVMVFEGDALLVRAAVAFLTSLEAKLFGASTAEEICRIVKEGIAGIGEEEWMRLVRAAGKS